MIINEACQLVKATANVLPLEGDARVVGPLENAVGQVSCHVTCARVYVESNPKKKTGEKSGYLSASSRRQTPIHRGNHLLCGRYGVRVVDWLVVCRVGRLLFGGFLDGDSGGASVEEADPQAGGSSGLWPLWRGG